jgi:hypothetical protein
MAFIQLKKIDFVTSKKISGVAYRPFVFYLYVIILNIYEQLFAYYRPMKVIIDNNHLKVEGNWNLKEPMEVTGS